MSTDSTLPPPVEDPSSPLLRPCRRRWPLVLLLVLALALAGAGGVYAWANLGPLLPSFVKEVTGADAGERSALPDLLAAQEKTAEEVEALGKSVSEQQEQLKTMIDQIAALSAKVDVLQRPAPAVMPAPMPQQATAPPRQAALAVPKPKKPAAPHAPKPSGPISTGGAPLNAAPDQGAR